MASEKKYRHVYNMAFHKAGFIERFILSLMTMKLYRVGNIEMKYKAIADRLYVYGTNSNKLNTISGNFHNYRSN